jgi:hypothetical protein
VRRVIAYDIMTNGLECFLRPLPPQAQKEILGWIATGNEGAVDKFFAEAMAKSLLLDWMTKLAWTEPLRCEAVEQSEEINIPFRIMRPCFFDQIIGSATRAR